MLNTSSLYSIDDFCMTYHGIYTDGCIFNWVGGGDGAAAAVTTVAAANDDFCLVVDATREVYCWERRT